MRHVFRNAPHFRDAVHTGRLSYDSYRLRHGRRDNTAKLTPLPHAARRRLHLYMETVNLLAIHLRSLWIPNYPSIE